MAEYVTKTTITLGKSGTHYVTHAVRNSIGEVYRATAAIRTPKQIRALVQESRLQAIRNETIDKTGKMMSLEDALKLHEAEYTDKSEEE